MLSAASIPTRFAERTLDGYRTSTESSRRALELARKLVAGAIDGLVLIGQTGVGKSHLAAGIVNALVAAADARYSASERLYAEWSAAHEAMRALEPARPSNDPELVAAAEAWAERDRAHAAAKAEWAAIRENHWRRQPSEPRPSDAWAAWDGEAPALTARMKAILGGSPEPGHRPHPGPTRTDADRYHGEHEAWRASMALHSTEAPSRRRESEPAWENVAELILGLRMEMGEPPDDRHNAMRVLRLRRHPALVVLDDLGREKSSDWTGETIYTLVNARYEEELPTLVTSNLTAPELAASPYWPVISRLAEDGALVEISAPDHRLAKR